MNQVITQGIGYIALLFIILSFQNKKRVNILIVMLIGLVLFVVHYILLGAWTGAVMNLIEAGVVYVSHQKETKSWAKKNFWLYLFLALFVIAGFFTYKNFVGTLPVLAQIIGTVAIWQKSEKTTRLMLLGPRPLWFIYNFAVGSFAGMAAEIFIFLSVVTGIIRFDILGKKSKRTK